MHALRAPVFGGTMKRDRNLIRTPIWGECQCSVQARAASKRCDRRYVHNRRTRAIQRLRCSKEFHGACI